MTVSELAASGTYEVLVFPDSAAALPITGAYAGDLLSWVMGRAQEGNAFLTIMTNINVVAVAALRELSCVIFCENVPVGDDVIAAAKEKEITLLRTGDALYEACVHLSDCLK